MSTISLRNWLMPNLRSSGSVIMNLVDGTLFSGLYRKSVFQAMYDSLQHGVPDVYATGFLALHGRLLYAPDIYLSRVNGSHKTTAELVEQRKKDFASDRPFDVWLEYALRLVDMVDASEAWKSDMKRRARERHGTMYAHVEEYY